jgi:hypothetical protein
MSTISATTWILVAVVAVIAISAIAAWKLVQTRRTERLRAQFGTEYARELWKTQDRNRAEKTLEDRWKRIENLHIRPLRDRSCFIESWRMVQAQFVDNPGGALVEADKLLKDVMSTRGYPTAEADFEQRVADISVEYPSVVEHYRAAHALALLHARGGASTEDLRQATIHYRLLFEALISEPIEVRARMAS